jgi:hypothetical protein
MAKGMVGNVHLPIEVVSALGKPLLPNINAKSFVSQCGFVVRDIIPMTVRDLNKATKGNGVSFIDDRCKDCLW